MHHTPNIVPRQMNPIYRPISLGKRHKRPTITYSSMNWVLQGLGTRATNARVKPPLLSPGGFVLVLVHLTPWHFVYSHKRLSSSKEVRNFLLALPKQCLLTRTTLRTRSIWIRSRNIPTKKPTRYGASTNPVRLWLESTIYILKLES